MRRRQFLVTLPVAAGLTGCTVGSAPKQASSRESSPARVVLRSSLRYVVNDDAIGVEPPENDQFAFVEPPSIGEAPAPETATLDLDGERFTPRSDAPGFMLSTPGVDDAYTTEKPRGWLVFDLPTVGADRGTLIHDGTRYPLSEDSLSRFAAAPAFSVQSLTVPESVPPDGSLGVSVQVRNTGDRTGLFLAGLQRGGRYETFEPSVEPGETSRQTRRIEVIADAGGAMYVQFVSAEYDEGFRVRVEEGGENASG